jgi:hypothetical protein
MADGDEIPDRVVASALEFAVGLAAAGTKLRPPLPFPVELRPFLKFTKLPVKALRDVRRAVEGDRDFMGRLAMVAVPELVDDAGMLWLTRPDGWLAGLTELASSHEATTLDGAAALRRAERRREAAEQATHRALAEVASLRHELARTTVAQAEANAEVEQLRRERESLRGEAATHQAELRRAIYRLSTAQARLEAQRAEAAAAVLRATEAERMRDVALADRAGGPADTGSDNSIQAVLTGAATVAADLAQQAQQARSLSIELGRLAGRLESLEPVAATKTARVTTSRKRRTSSRKPVALPGGVYGSSSVATEYLVRHPGMVVLVDGYNVAKLGWPLLDLEHQRERCIETGEDVARRFGANIAVIFDGATVAGANASVRRLVRVAFSPEGVIADDVLRAEVDTIPDNVPVLVVTNDQAVIADVRAMGANTLSSDQWLELARR